MEDRVVKIHLYKHDFHPNYWIWTDHGEQIVKDDLDNNNDCIGTTRGVEDDQFLSMQDMVYDALRQQQSSQPPSSNTMEEASNEQTQRFYNLLLDANTSLYERALDSKLSMCVKLLACKSNWNVPDQCLEFISKMLLDVAPTNSNLPKSYYDSKRLVSKLGLEAKRIDCCVNGCMLFYDNGSDKNDGALLKCKFCHKPRYRDHNTGASNKKLVPVKAMFYLPIIPRLQRMYASTQTAREMTWHYDNKSNNGVLRHPCDAEAWKHFDKVYPDFAVEPRNVWLGLCSDGFNPYVQASNAPYSCWPIIVTPYNLSPEMCMSKPYMFLSCLIPGPSIRKLVLMSFWSP